MIRKLIYSCFVLILLGLVLVLYLRLDDKKPLDVEEQAFNMIPDDAALVIYSRDGMDLFHKINHENLVWQQLRELPLFQGGSDAFNRVDSLLSGELDIDMNVKDASICLSLHPKGISGFYPLLVIESPTTLKEESAHKIFKGLYGSALQVEEKKYNDFRIKSIKDSTGAIYGAYFINDNWLVWSPSDLLLEKSIGALDVMDGVGKDPGFRHIAKTAGKNVEGNLFVNFKQLGKVLGQWMNKTHFLNESVIGKWGSWAALDLHPDGQSLLMDGFMNYGEADEFTVRFKNQTPGVFSSVGIMPQSTRYYHSFGISDLNTYLLYYPTNVNEKEKLDVWAVNWEKDHGENPLDVLKHLSGGEISKLSTLDKVNEAVYLILKLKSNATAQEYFEDLFNKLAETKQLNPESFKKQMKVDDATSYFYYNFPVNEVIEKYFGPMFKVDELKSFVFYDNYLVMGKGAAELKEFLYQNLLGQTLPENQNYSDFEKNLGVKSNFQMFLDFRNADEAMRKIFSSSFINENMSGTDGLKHLNALGFQLVSSKENVYANMYLDYAGERREEAQTLWKSLLDTSFVTKPALVENHYTHEKEICVQDQKNILYLISPSGRIIWKKPLAEPILGEIHQIDKFKNGKLQLLFNTASQVHLLDRNGNYVNRYPFSLSSKATGELGLIDYDKTRDYRIFVPCEDKSVQLFDKDGNKLKGWGFDGADYPVNSKIYHFRVDTKDFIVFADKNRIYMLNRQGQVRLRLKEQFSKSPGSPITFDESGPNGEPCLVTTDTNGNIKYIYFNGTVTTKSSVVSDNSHAFMYDDLDGDRREEFIFLESKKLSVYNQNMTRLFEYKFNNTITHLPYIYQFSVREKKIGIIDSRERNIYLFNSDGTLAKGFPLTGNSPFTLGFMKNEASSFNLIVGGEGNFIYNYRVK